MTGIRLRTEKNKKSTLLPEFKLSQMKNRNSSLWNNWRQKAEIIYQNDFSWSIGDKSQTANCFSEKHEAQFPRRGNKYTCGCDAEPHTPTRNPLNLHVNKVFYKTSALKGSTSQHPALSKPQTHARHATPLYERAARQTHLHPRKTATVTVMIQISSLHCETWISGRVLHLFSRFSERKQ